MSTSQGLFTQSAVDCKKLKTYSNLILTRGQWSLPLKNLKKDQCRSGGINTHDYSLAAILVWSWAFLPLTRQVAGSISELCVLIQKHTEASRKLFLFISIFFQSR